MITYLALFIAGGAAGMAIMALCTAAGQADRDFELMNGKDDL
jgi:hypothetical protein